MAGTHTICLLPHFLFLVLDYWGLCQLPSDPGNTVVVLICCGLGSSSRYRASTGWTVRRSNPTPRPTQSPAQWVGGFVSRG